MSIILRDATTSTQEATVDSSGNLHVNVANASAITVTAATAGSVTGGTAGTASDLVGGIYHSSAPTLTNGQQASLQLTSAGALNVAVVSGGGANASVGTVGNTAPSSATAIGWEDGSSNLQIPSASNPLPVSLPSATVTTLTPVTAAAIASAIVSNPPTTFNGVVTNAGAFAVQATGTLTDNNAAPSTNNLGVLSALATFNRPGKTQGNLTTLSVDLDGALRTHQRAESVLGDLVGTLRYNQLEINFSQTFDPTLVTNTVTGGSTVAPTQSAGQAIYATGAASSKDCNGTSVQQLKYRPSHEWYAYFSASFTTGAAGSHQRIGCFNATDGFYLGYEGTTFGLTQLIGSSPTQTAIASFNGDQCTGAVNSAFTRRGVPEAIILTNNNIYRIHGAWFGTAPVILEVFSPDGVWVTMHTFLYPNSLTSPYCVTTNWNMQVDVANTTNATNIAIATPCWAMGVCDGNAPLEELVTDQSLAILNRTVLVGKNAATNTYSNVELSPDNAIEIAFSGNSHASTYTFDPTHTATQSILTGVSTYTTLTVQLIGTGTIAGGALEFQGSLDGTNWINLSAYNMGTNTLVPSFGIGLATGTTIYQVPIAGFPYVRVVNNITISGSSTPQVVFSYSLGSLSFITAPAYNTVQDVADGPNQPGTASGYSTLVGGVFTSPYGSVNLSNGQQSALQLDTIGNLLVKDTSVTAVTDAGGTNLNTDLQMILGHAVTAAADGIQKVGISGHAGISLDAVLAATKPANVLQVGGNDGTNAYAIPMTAGGAAVLVSATPATSGGLTTSSASGLTHTAVAIKATAGQVYGYFLDNTENTAATFFQFFNATATATNSTGVGTAVPLFSIGVPASGSANLTFPIGVAFSSAICIAATTTYGGATAPSNTVSYTVWYA